jgi:FAD/FMN-containing dehydrogenase
MGQPVKLSDELVNEARIAGATMQRSIAGQVEFWAKVGRAVELVTNRAQVERLQHKATLPLSEIVRTVNGPAGKARLDAYLNSRPFPRYFAHPELPQTMIREDSDGAKTVGKFNGRVFEPLATPSTRELSA